MARSDRQLRFTNPVARTRTLSDEQILHLIAHALGDADNAWTLADAAAAAGLHPATLIKRFGSRRGLLIALSRRWVDSIPTAPTTEDAHRELLTWIESLSTSDTTGDQMLTRLDMLVEDLRDPELRVLLRVRVPRPGPHRRTHDHTCSRPSRGRPTSVPRAAGRDSTGPPWNFQHQLGHDQYPLPRRFMTPALPDKLGPPAPPSSTPPAANHRRGVRGRRVR